MAPTTVGFTFYHTRLVQESNWRIGRLDASRPTKPSGHQCLYNSSEEIKGIANWSSRCNRVIPSIFADRRSEFKDKELVEMAEILSFHMRWWLTEAVC